MLTRRTFMERLAAVAAVAALPLSMVQANRVETDGHDDHLTPETVDGRNVDRVLFNGADISNECCELNRREGWARVFVREEVGGDVAVDYFSGDFWKKTMRMPNGKFVSTPDPIHVTTILRGDIVVSWKDKPIDRSTLRKACVTKSGWIQLSAPGREFDKSHNDR